MSKCGGQMGNTGCVSYMFDQKGYIVVERTLELDEDTMMEYALDAGADDVVVGEDVYEIFTSPADFSAVRTNLEAKNISFLQAEISMIPQSKVSLEGDKLETFRKMLEKLEDLDDVQEVYHNVDLPEDEEEE